MSCPAFCLGAVLAVSALPGAPQVVDLKSVSAKGVGEGLGSVELTESEHGVVFTPKLKGLPPGLHGFHVHEKPDCTPGKKDGKPAAAQAAGDHYDPEGSKKHGAPWGDGHKGDLPALYVDKNGEAEQPVLAPRLTLAELKGRSLMIHAGADNHSDHPEPSGGGGKRLACGVIP